MENGLDLLSEMDLLTGGIANVLKMQREDMKTAEQ